MLSQQISIQFATLIQDYKQKLALLQQDSISQIDPQEESKFKWLNPPDQELQESDVKEILSNLAPNLKEQLALDPESQQFYQDDIRALSLYLSILPTQDLKLEQDDEKLIDINQYNDFFQKNYIYTQAYKLSHKEMQGYTLYIKKNGFISWPEYVQLTLNQKQVTSQDATEKEPNYSISYFLTDLKEEDKQEFLSFLPDKDKEDSYQNQENLQNYQNQQFNNIFNNQLNQPQNLPSEFTPLSSEEPFSDTNTSYSDINDSFDTANQPIINPTQSNLKALSSTQVQQDLNPNLKSITNIESSTNIQLKDQKQINASQASTSTNQNQLESADSDTENYLNNLQNYQNQVIKANLLDQAQKEQASRQKQWNYAKIIGYSSAGVIGGVSGGLTIFTTLFS